ncbi:MAG: RNA polymerase sigma-70 factor (ECF subfamily) [Phenylobacterium sp.]|jgi:RNA polymerase sigma-70 factor (ECF subfamily)
MGYRHCLPWLFTLGKVPIGMGIVITAFMDHTQRPHDNFSGPDTIAVTVVNATEDQNVPPLTMEAFLADIEKKAYHMAAFATGSHADALDLLQDAMIKLVTNYQSRPANEWKPLFYRILQNRIRDWHRHQKVRNLVLFWKKPNQDDEVEEWPPAADYNDAFGTPESDMEKAQQQKAALEHLKQLSDKQQQCFMLRSWEGLSVAQTADAMGCSQGSVKTHYFRALTKMRSLMEADHEITF